MEPVAASATKAAHTAAPQPSLQIGYIAYPPNFKQRHLLRQFRKALTNHANADDVVSEYVFGDSYFGETPTLRVQARIAREYTRENDIVFVDAREKLPHVGKATEKSSAWWLDAPRRSSARFFCKTDDDSLIHTPRLRDILLEAERETNNPYIFASYIRWRGWIPQYHFQACGGGWGGPADAWKQMLDPKNKCYRAEGPFPQGTGTLTCMSRALALELASDAAFGMWHQIAKVRNDYGTPCRRATLCANQSYATHMWHHEDAGISYNVWKLSQRLGKRIALVHFPENGGFWPWPSSKLRHPKNSERAFVVHKVSPKNFEQVSNNWNHLGPHPRIKIDCSQSCQFWGYNHARVPCARVPALGAEYKWRGFKQQWDGSLCEVDTAPLYSCCYLDYLLPNGTRDVKVAT